MLEHDERILDGFRYPYHKSDVPSPISGYRLGRSMSIHEAQRPSEWSYFAWEKYSATAAQFTSSKKASMYSARRFWYFR